MSKHSLVSGLLNIDKPKGLTSHDVVARVRKLSKQRKVGHTGTLDPMATGVLLVCLGQATRLIEYLMLTQKQYRAVIQFGTVTDTLDVEGQVIAQNDVSALTENHLREILPMFLGEIEQIPPVFSALKRNGQPLYKRARAGESVPLDPRPVTIHNLNWITWNSPNLTLDITCSPGTYIRALARDLGEKVGTGAHLAELTRTANGPWLLEQAVSLDKLEREVQADALNWQNYLYPPDRAITHLPKVMLDEIAVSHIKHGRQIQLSVTESDGSTAQDEKTVNLLRAYTPTGKFLAILKPAEADRSVWHPKKVFD